MRKKALWAILIILVAAVLWTYRGDLSGKDGSGKGPAEIKEGAPREGLEQKIMSFTIDGRSSKGVKQWHLEGDAAEIIKDDIHLDNLVAVVYGEEATVNLTSDRGIYRKGKGEVELVGNVEAVSDSGFYLTTEKAKWSQETKEISTYEAVYVKDEGMTAVGKGGKANSDEKTAVLNKDVSVRIEPDTKVDCSGSLHIDYNRNIAIFHEDVVVEDKDGKLFADKLTVEFDPETRKLARVTAEGNVKVKRGNSYTISEKAIYTESTKSAQLLGKPRVIIDPAELTEFDNLGKGGDPEGGGR
ncbi:MAG: LPS export ABC transporter periplasmic protein LptC [Candidatus Omnitrophota bacterium]|nr:LPS export ABC transporter periplasmic protein LptC [Candidatus Omnitrophota bacterium]